MHVEAGRLPGGTRSGRSGTQPPPLSAVLAGLRLARFQEAVGVKRKGGNEGGNF